jgi:hypothetical protein
MASSGVSRRQFRTVGVHRGDDDEEAKERGEELLISEPYIPGIKTNGQFFSSLLPQELLGEIKGYLEDKKCKVTTDGKKYKLKAIVKSLEDDEEEGSGDEGDKKTEDETISTAEDPNAVQLSVKILQVEEKKRYCVEFNRIDGDSLVFYQIVQKIRDDLADLANA